MKRLLFFFHTYIINISEVCKIKTYKYIDLFAGIGGFRIAMQSIGGKCVFSSEWDEMAKKTYLLNYGEVPFGDITKIKIKVDVNATKKHIL